MEQTYAFTIGEGCSLHARRQVREVMESQPLLLEADLDLMAAAPTASLTAALNRRGTGIIGWAPPADPSRRRAGIEGWMSNYSERKSPVMVVQQMRKLGINSDVLQILGFASIFASIATWRAAKESGDSARAERFGIFIGLWAPTFFALASEVAVHEAKDDEVEST